MEQTPPQHRQFTLEELLKRLFQNEDYLQHRENCSAEQEEATAFLKQLELTEESIMAMWCDYLGWSSSQIKETHPKLKGKNVIYNARNLYLEGIAQALQQDIIQNLESDLLPYPAYWSRAFPSASGVHLNSILLPFFADGEYTKTMSGITDDAISFFAQSPQRAIQISAYCSYMGKTNAEIAEELTKQEYHQIVLPNGTRIEGTSKRNLGNIYGEFSRALGLSDLNSLSSHQYITNRRMRMLVKQRQIFIDEKQRQAAEF
jgi:hypothetical protein